MSRLAGSRPGRTLVCVAGGFAAGSTGGFLLGPRADVTLPLGAAAAGAAVLLAGGGSRRGRRSLVATVTLAALLLGATRGAAAVRHPGRGDVDGHFGTRPVVITGVVRAVPPAAATHVIVDATHLVDSESDGSVSGGVLVTGTRLSSMAPGDRVTVEAQAIRPPGHRPGPVSEAALERDDVFAVAVSAQVTVTATGPPSPARVIAAVQGRLAEAVDSALPEPAAALMLGIAFGIRQPLSTDVRAPLQDAGLIHVVVLSGLKVVLILGLIAALARVLQWSRRRTLVVAIPVVAAYVLISGSGPAAIRSALMAGVALMAATGARRTDPLPALALAAAAMLGVQPQLVEDPGFQLSFLGTAGILMLAAPLAAWLPGPRLLVEPFATTIAAQVATLPVMASTFGVVAIAGPIANALVLPMLPMLIVAGGGGAVLAAVHPALGWLPLQLAGLGADAVVAIGACLAAIPGAAVHVGIWPAAWTAAAVAGLCAFGGFVLWRVRGCDGPRQARRMVAIAAASGLAVAGAAGVVASQPDGSLHMTVLDTGSAPAVLVQGSSGGVALIDGGSSPTALVQSIGRVLPLTTRRIDMVVLTGSEQIAAAGLAGLPGHYDVGTVVVPGDLSPGARAIAATLQASGATVVAPQGSAWSFGGATWRCLPVIAASGSALCAVSIADHSGRALVLGDAGTAAQDVLAATCPGGLAADVVVTPAGGALSAALLRFARPAVIAVPVAKGGRALPGPAQVTLLRTGVDGDLHFVGGVGGLAPAT